jgi:hypothetical protein
VRKALQKVRPLFDKSAKNSAAIFPAADIFMQTLLSFTAEIFASWQHYSSVTFQFNSIQFNSILFACDEILPKGDFFYRGGDLFNHVEDIYYR